MKDSVARSDEFDQHLAESTVVKALVSTGKTNRKIIRWLAFSVALDIGLSISLIFLALGAQRTAATADSAQTQARLQCKAGNEARAAQLQLWDYILSMSPGKTRKQKQQAVQFRKYVARVFAQRDCSNPQQAATATGAPPKLPTMPTPQMVSTPAASVVTLKPTIIVEEQPRGSSSPSPSASASPSRSPPPSPSPSPSKTCFIVHLVCVPPGRNRK